MKLISSRTQTILSLSMLKGVGPAALKKVATIDGFWDMSIEDLARAITQIGRALGIEGAWAHALEAADKQVAFADKHRACILSPLDPDYPRLLAETKDDPFLIYVKGKLAKASDKSVAVIGTREPTATGVVIAQRVAHTFVEQGWSIVSGLAIGCDSIAHRAALDAGGHTVAILAHGLQMISPSRHRELAQEILEAGGALVSEYPFGQGVQAQQFVKRDRTQAGMAQGVVMIQSDLKGGSLHASRAALDYERWLAVPYPTAKDVQLQEPKVQGNLLIADGTAAEKSSLLRCSTTALARVRVLRGRDDILRLAGANVETSDKFEELSASDTLMEPQMFGDHEIALDAVQTSPDERAVLAQDGAPAEEDEHRPSGLSSDKVAIEAAAPPPGDPSEVAAADQLPMPMIAAHTHTTQSEPVQNRRKSSSKRSVRYHVALRDPHYRGELRILKLPLPTSIMGSTDSRMVEAHRDLVVALATRLEHIQACLDEVGRAHALESKVLDKATSLHLQFFIEDALMHMKRTVDGLGLLETAKPLHMSVKVRSSKQLSLLDVQGDDYLDLVPVLDEIVKALPVSVAVLSETRALRASVRRDDLVDVAFHDLVDSFNGLVSQALGVDTASDFTRSRDHANQSS